MRAYLHAKTVPPWLAVKSVLTALGSTRAFHACVLAGNDEARGGEEIQDQTRTNRETGFSTTDVTPYLDVCGYGNGPTCLTDRSLSSYID